MSSYYHLEETKEPTSVALHLISMFKTYYQCGMGCSSSWDQTKEPDKLGDRLPQHATQKNWLIWCSIHNISKIFIHKYSWEIVLTKYILLSLHLHKLCCPTLAKGSKWQILQLWVIHNFRLDSACSTSRPSLEQKNPSYWETFKFRRHNNALTSMWMTDTFC